MKALIIGYGSAGKRHHKLIQNRFDTIGIADTDPSKLMDALEYDENVFIYVDPEEALVDVDWDVAVICTPPNLHIEQLLSCMDIGLSVLCEKPLCDFGQLDEAWDLMNHANWRKVMVAYNYLFHVFELESPRYAGLYSLRSWDYRETLPGWGLLLDNGSHAVSILNYLSNDVMIPTQSHIEISGHYQATVINGKTKNSGDPFEIVDQVNGEMSRQIAVSTPDGSHDFIPDHRMFDLMWESFLEGIEINTPQWPGLDFAIDVQVALEQANKLLVEEVG